MCRMIVASGNFDAAKIVESAVLMAKDENSIHELNEKKGPGSCQHPDGWGAAYLNKAGEFVVERSTQAIFGSSEAGKLRKLGKIKTNLLIMHVRKKSEGEAALENTHPFMVKHPRLGSCVFCHNGTIKGKITFDPKFKPKGDTDSERLFYAILSNFEENKGPETDRSGPKNNPENVIRNTLQRYKTEGTNIILATKEKTYVAIRKNELSKYFCMSIGQGKDYLIISSEKLKTFPHLLWKAAEPGEVIIFENGSAKYVFSKETKGFLQKLNSIIKTA